MIDKERVFVLGKKSWYDETAFLLQIDYHARREDPVGSDADPETTERLLLDSGAETYQIHAKGNPGYTTYPSDTGHNPPELEGDVIRLWTEIAKKHGKPFVCYYNIGRDKAIMERRPEWN